MCGNYILLTDVSDISQLYQSLRSCFKAFTLLHEHSYDFLNAIYNSEDSMKSLIDMTAKIIGHPVALHDKALTFIYANEISQEEYSQFPLAIDPGDHSIIDSFAYGIHYPIMFSYESWPNILISPIWIDGEFQYFLSTLDTNGTISEFVFPFMACIAILFEKTFSSNQISAKTNDRIHEFFNHIITGKAATNDEILRSTDSIGLYLKEYNYMLVVSNQNKNTLYQDVYSFYYDICNNLIYHTILIYEYKIIILLSGSTLASVQDTIESYKLFIHQKAASGWRGCLSFVFHSVCDISIAYNQCRAAEQFGEQLKVQNTIFDYKNFMSHHLLSQSADYFNIQDFCLPLVTEIISYDRMNDTEYSITLYHYIKNFMNINKVAKLLNVHRNTSAYRVSRISELFHLDYEDFAAMNNLGLSFDILTCTGNNMGTG